LSGVLKIDTFEIHTLLSDVNYFISALATFLFDVGKYLYKIYAHNIIWKL